MTERRVGQVVWFDDRKGYGFVRHETRDLFVHHSHLRPTTAVRRLLITGEYVEFTPRPGDDGRVTATDVTGVGGLSLLCENVVLGRVRPDAPAAARADALDEFKQNEADLE